MSEGNPIAGKKEYSTFSIIDGNGRTLSFFSFAVAPGIKNEPSNALAVTASRFGRKGSKGEIIFSQPNIVVTVAEMLSEPEESKFSNYGEIKKAMEKKGCKCSQPNQPIRIVVWPQGVTLTIEQFKEKIEIAQKEGK